LKGKIVNAKETNQEIIKSDPQLQSIMKAMGLNFGKVNQKELRYQKIIIIASSDPYGK
jgi:DNA gyrase/topoisomerase IV subunit B